MTKQLRLTTAHSASFILTAMLILSPAGVSAAVLGEPTVLSSIGEPLRIEIPVLGGNLARVAECLRVVSDHPQDGLTWVRDGRIGTTGRGASARVVISHPAPSFEPVLKLGIEDICESRLRREYTLLLSFPSEVATPAAPLATGNGGRASRTDEIARPPQPPRRPRPRATRESGQAGAPAPATASPAGSSARPATPAEKPKAAPAGDQDRLVLGGGSDEVPGAGLRMSTELASLDRISATSDTQRDQLRREQVVTMAIDRTIVAQLELNDRIRQLEEVQAQMMERAQALAMTPNAPVTPPAPASAPTSARERASDWLYPVTAFGGVSLALAAALLWMRRRRTESSPEHDFELPSEHAVEPGIAHAPHPFGAPYESSDSAAALRQPAAPSHGVARAPQGWETAEEAIEIPIASITPIAPFAAAEEAAEEHESAIELAEIMMGFGRIQGAAETLAEFIASNPKKAVTPWLKLLEVYRAAGLREEFDALARQLNKTFNVKSVTWDTFDEARQSKHSMEQMAHVTKNVQQLWGTPECQAYLEKLLRDNRDGTREGFPLSVIDEILVLAAILEEQLGPYRPPPELGAAAPDATPASQVLPIPQEASRSDNTLG